MKANRIQIDRIKGRNMRQDYIKSTSEDYYNHLKSYPIMWQYSQVNPYQDCIVRKFEYDIILPIPDNYESAERQQERRELTKSKIPNLLKNILNFD